jgi:vitamin B12 transporter
VTRRMLVIAMVLVAGAVGVVRAADEPPKVLDPLLVTATMTETPASRLGSSVTVITEDEIRTYNYDRVEDALRYIPGVDIQRSGSLGKTTSLRIRGSSTSQVQVLVDGMRVKSPTLGEADLSDLTLDAIDRIEIVRGPQAALHGADAIGGVVNIITKKGQGPIHGSAWVEGGSYGTFREQLNVQGAYGGFNFNLSGTRWDTDGQFPNDAGDQTSFGGRVGYDFPWKGELFVTGRYSKLNLQLPIFFTVPTVFDPNARSQSESYLFNIVYKQPIFPWWEVQARYGQWYNNSGFQNFPPPGTFTTISQIDTRRLEAELLNTFRLGNWDTLTIGAEYRSEFGHNTSLGSFPTRFSRELNTVSVFGHNELRLFDRVFLGGGVRYEDNDTFGTAVTPQASIAIVIKETGTKLRGTWGKGFRAPTINDLFFPGFGNKDLKPEHSESYDLGFDQSFWQKRIRAGFTFFHNQFENLIQIIPDAFGNFLPFNVGRAKTEGVEAYLEADPLDWLGFYINYTYTSTRDIDTHLDLRRVPRHRWSTGVTFTPWERLTLFAQANVVSSQFESSFAGRNPGYHRIDTGGTLRLLGRPGGSRLELTLRIENVTKEEYEEVLGFPALGLNAMVGLRAFYR